MQKLVFLIETYSLILIFVLLYFVLSSCAGQVEGFYIIRSASETAPQYLTDTRREDFKIIQSPPVPFLFFLHGGAVIGIEFFDIHTEQRIIILESDPLNYKMFFVSDAAVEL